MTSLVYPGKPSRTDAPENVRKPKVWFGLVLFERERERER